MSYFPHCAILCLAIKDTTVCSSVIGTVEKRGCLEAKGWIYKKSMFSKFFIQYFTVILVQNKFSVSLIIDL